MKRFDENIRQMAKGESVVLPDGFEQRTDALLVQLTAQKTEQGTQRKISKRLLIAATLVLAVALVSIAYGTGIISSIWYNFSGEVTHTEYEKNQLPAPVEPANNPERYVDSEEELAFMAEAAAGELRRTGSLSANGKLSPRRTGSLTQETEWEELKRLIEESKGPALMLPTAFPDGYDAATAEVIFYLSPEYVDPLKPADESREGVDGHIMQIFRMPEEYRRYARGYSLTFYRTENRYIEVDCSMRGETAADMNFTLDETAVVENPPVKGFEKTLLFKNVNPDGGGAGVETQDI